MHAMSPTVYITILNPSTLNIYALPPKHHINRAQHSEDKCYSKYDFENIFLSILLVIIL